MKQFRWCQRLVVVGCIGLSMACTDQSDSLNNVYAQKKGSYPLNTHHLDDQGEPIYTNRLIRQNSLYLLQHAHNPVDWWSWGDDAFTAAREADKPILLSIGYSTCHWCHVMERESFENLEIATFINQHFIPIKVDREEHPDVDELYINAVQNLSGTSGWPLTAVLTPEGLPFFGGTYFPPEKFLSLLNRISSTWAERRDAIMEQAERVRKSLDQNRSTNASLSKLDEDFIVLATQRISEGLRYPAGGGTATFPREPEMLFALEQSMRDMQHDTLKSLAPRLTEITNGGIQDQLAGGFHRYTVDRDWQIPHFEKMLYNQAQLAQVFSNYYLLTGDGQALMTATRTLDFMLSDMQSNSGAFYAAMDAESEGAEGTFYVWSLQQLQAVLGEEDMALAQRVFGVSSQGNFENNNVLTVRSPVEEVDRAPLAVLKKNLLAARAQRVHPLTDTKIISAWNGLAISALVKGYHASGEQRYLDSANKAADTLWSSAYSSAGLARTVHQNGDVGIKGVLGDYANLANAFLDLYDISANQFWLDRAVTLAAHLQDDFRSEGAGAFNTSAEEHSNNLIVKMISAQDDALVSGNSMAAQVFARLYRRTGSLDYRTTAEGVIAAFSERLLKQPSSLSGMLNALALLEQGESGPVQYAAKGRVKVRSTISEDQLKLQIDIAPGWHINSYRVLESDLIPSQLQAVDSECPSVMPANYPSDKKVKLGFQDDELLVYENQLQISAEVNSSNSLACRTVAASFQMQACSNEVCLEPENLKIRAYRNDK